MFFKDLSLQTVLQQTKTTMIFHSFRNSMHDISQPLDRALGSELDMQTDSKGSGLLGTQNLLGRQTPLQASVIPSDESHDQGSASCEIKLSGKKPRKCGLTHQRTAQTISSVSQWDVGQWSAALFWKRPNSALFWLCRPGSVLHSHSTLPCL